VKSLVYQLPTVFGTIAAMLVTLVSVVNETSPVSCLVKAVTAFTVFTGFGMVLRYALLTIEEKEERDREEQAQNAALSLDAIRPGISVAEALGETERDAEETAA
jgi:hypothetical protein